MIHSLDNYYLPRRESHLLYFERMATLSHRNFYLKYYMKGEHYLSQDVNCTAIDIIAAVVVKTKVDLKISWQFDETLDLPTNLMDLFSMFITVKYNNL